jgi:hypothetical protein
MDTQVLKGGAVGWAGLALEGGGHGADHKDPNLGNLLKKLNVEMNKLHRCFDGLEKDVSRIRECPSLRVLVCHMHACQGLTIGMQHVLHTDSDLLTFTQRLLSLSQEKPRALQPSQKKT